MVFVHGSPGSSHDFCGLLAAVGEHVRAVALDMPGFGQADKPQDFPQNTLGHATHLGGVITELGIERVHLVLHDFGGPWGIAWALGHLSSVASITLIDTGVVTDHRWHWPARLWMTPGIGEVFARLLGIPALFKAMLSYGYSFKPAPTPLPADFLAHMAADFDRGTQDSVLRLYRDAQNAEEFSEFLSNTLRPHNIPSLVIWGGRDHFLPVKHAYQQRTTFPSAQILVVDKAGHWPQVTHQAETASALTNFLKPLLSETGHADRSDPHSPRDAN
ncbi:hypothetical protein BKG84_10880 [Mycobacteroides chelonae]|uniref:AB hydrolase-1 domain-containing protein n=1 Tax=Mycobacteroides chelonae TaxID=1774 RepID=A0A1S1MA77_MYCCH|nr:hypothetical protein BKG84_10880 [Mycobacteroides chelonae]